MIDVLAAYDVIHHVASALGLCQQQGISGRIFHWLNEASSSTVRILHGNLSVDMA